jgi:cytochrome c oxidase assembly protein subunit 15
MGLVFIVPFVLFLRRGLLKGWLLRRTIAIMVGGGIVASLGWFMVLSGLVDLRDANGQLLVSVSHFRLAIHLNAAFAVFGLVWWTVLDLRGGRRSFAGNGGPAARWMRGLLALLVLQIVYGAFTAGLDAGRIYNTWPLMNGQFIPENVHAFGDLVTDLTAHRDGVQFVHRTLAWLVAAAFIGAAVHFRRSPGVQQAWRWLVAGVLVQFTLGVLTVLSHVDIALGVAHQLGALLLLAACLVAVHGTGRSVAT